MDAAHLRKYIVRPALDAIGLNSKSAENLVVGTACQESHLRFVRQLEDGPAVGLFQMEPATYDDIWDNYLQYKQPLGEKILEAIEFSDIEPMILPDADRLVWDFRFAAIMCRVHYRRKKPPLPDADDLRGLARYWKKHYNTALGKGTEDEFVINFVRFGDWDDR